MSLKTRDIFHKDPLGWQLLNEGVSSNNTTDPTTLRYELQSFVCDGEYRTGLVRIIEGYLANFTSPEQKAVWVSGFYGSGKSHLVKVLRYLWTDYDFRDGNTARSIANLPDDVVALLKEVSTLGKKYHGLHAAGGTLKADKGSVRMRVLSIIFASIGFRREYPYAKFCLHLRRDGKLDEMRAAVKELGKDFDEEVAKLYSSAAIAKAYFKVYPHIGDVSKVGPTLRAEYPNVDDVGIDEMLDLIRLALGNGGKLPCTLVVLDEVQQFVDNRPDLALDIQEVTEACSKQLGSRVMFIGTGQSALSDSVQALQKLMGRYSIKVHLRDNDVEKVVRTVVLQKKEGSKAAVQDLVSKYEGEITRQLKGSKIGTQSDDHSAYVADFPLLPVRRRFWERLLHSIDPTGTTAQMRTQLRVVHEACRAYAERPLGAVVPADFIYEQLATDLVQTGEMQKRFQEIIDEQIKKPEGALRRRLCALVFLINKLPREAGTDIGVRAEAEHLADLLVDDLATGSTQLRQQIPSLLKTLVEDGVLMEVDAEYRLQTTEGAAWEGEFRKRRSAVLNDLPLLDSQRSQLFTQVLNGLFSGLMIKHGACNERRRVNAHIGSENPPAADGITLWIRDEFTDTQASVLNDIRQRSTDDATLHLFIPKSHADELKQAIASAQAADQTIHAKGNPTTTEGQEAKRAIATRLSNESQKNTDIAAQIVRQARLFLSGGQEQSVTDLATAVEAAGEEVLARLYPKFGLADSPNWPIVRKKAQEGAPNALQAVGYTGDVQTHPVADLLLKFIGAGKKGTDLRKHFTGGTFGWPQDAVDAMLTVLLVSNHLSARLQGAPLTAADSDIKKLGLAEYRVEQPVLGAAAKIALRKLYAAAGLSAKPGSELADAGLFLTAALALARSVGGDAPAPTIPSLATLQALEGKSGNELLHALHEQRDAITAALATWKKTSEAIGKRRPVFDRTERLLGCAAGSINTHDWANTLAAIRANRSLLDEPDSVAPVAKALGEALRTSLASTVAAYASALASGRARLSADPTWSKIAPPKQESLLASAGIQVRPAPTGGSDDELLSALTLCPLATWRAHTDALSAQFDRALSEAVKELEPKARRISLPGATLRTTADLDAWLAQVRTTIEANLKDGPVIL
jgi:hypothetical protein